MSSSFNLDAVVENLKLIADAIRCTVCDGQIKTKLRYPCGHIACANCAEGSSACFLCLTPPPEGSVPVIDECLTNRTSNILLLLKEFKEAYNIDIERWRCESNQLKLEKEVFPQCIQAPQKYDNKRKTGNTIGSDKENSYLFPGELVVHAKHRMNRSKSYVQDWLDQNEKELSDYKPRTPFSDLALNSPRNKSTSIKKRVDIILDKVKQDCENLTTNFRETPIRSRKRQHFVAQTSHKGQGLDNYLKCIGKGDLNKRSAKKVKSDFDIHESNFTGNKRKNERDESGIVMDDDAVIVIDDSQSEAINKRAAVDKDRQAWLAVLEADRNNSSAEKLSTDLQCNEIVQYTNEVEKSQNNVYSIAKNTPTSPDLLKSYLPSNHCVNNKNVPYYKRSCLKESCRDCEKSAKRSIKAKDVSITVETDSLRTTITVSKLTNKKPVKVSQTVQTENFALTEAKLNTQPKADTNLPPKLKDTNLPPKLKDKNLPPKLKDTNLPPELKDTNLPPKLKDASGPPVCNQESEDLFTMEQSVPAPAGESSDSDQEYGASGEITVTADVHRSVENESPSCLRRAGGRRAPASPASSHSSNKENRDPNRQRRPTAKKKKLML